jgi:hypothetical protein
VKEVHVKLTYNNLLNSENILKNMIVVKIYMHYCRNTTIHENTFLSKSQWTDGIQKDLSFLMLWFGTMQTHGKQPPSHIAMLDLASQYDDLRFNCL